MLNLKLESIRQLAAILRKLVEALETKRLLSSAHYYAEDGMEISFKSGYSISQGSQPL